ncbi:hypothetical protein [Corynebacterium nuruki]|uniref:hypothetical protein n=1 Tax=Corynebacterium nuruki TaxID=1032851 RepID=UPI0039BED865
MPRHRTAVELDKPRARDLMILAGDHGTAVSVIVRAMISHYLALPDGEARDDADAALSAAAAAEHERRGAVAAKGIHGREVEPEQAPDRRRIGLVLVPGMTDDMKDRSGTSAAVAMRALISHDLDLIAGEESPAQAALIEALDAASAAESARRGEVGRRVMTRRHAAEQPHREADDTASADNTDTQQDTEGDESRE